MAIFYRPFGPTDKIGHPGGPQFRKTASEADSSAPFLVSRTFPPMEFFSLSSFRNAHLKPIFSIFVRSLQPISRGKISASFNVCCLPKFCSHASFTRSSYRQDQVPPGVRRQGLPVNFRHLHMAWDGMFIEGMNCRQGLVVDRSF